MDKVNELSLHPSAEPARQDCMICGAYSDSLFYIGGKRVARLSVLLQQIQQSLGALEALPHPELFEIVSGAVSLSGFVNPTETAEVTAVVLDALEILAPAPESP